MDNKKINVQFFLLILISIFLSCSGSGDIVEGEVTNLRVEEIGNKYISLAWNEPLDSDFEKIIISCPEFETPIEIQKNIQKAEINLPLNSVKYIFTVKTISKSGKESTGKSVITIPKANIKSIKSYIHAMGTCIGCDYNGPCLYEDINDYNSSGNIIRTTSFKLNGYDENSDCITEPLLWNYSLNEFDEMGNLIKSFSYDNNDELQYTYSFEYNANMLTGYNKYNNNGSVVEECKYDYYGNTTEVVSYGNDGTIISHNLFDYEYNDFGDIVMSREYRAIDDLGNLLGSPELISYKQYEYNNYNDLIKKKYFDSNEEIKDEMSYEYNEDRTLSEVRNAWQILNIYEYDENGNMIFSRVYRLPDEFNEFNYVYE